MKKYFSYGQRSITSVNFYKITFESERWIFSLQTWQRCVLENVQVLDVHTIVVRVFMGLTMVSRGQNIFIIITNIFEETQLKTYWNLCVWLNTLNVNKKNKRIHMMVNCSVKRHVWIIKYIVNTPAKGTFEFCIWQ